MYKKLEHLLQGMCDPAQYFNTQCKNFGNSIFAISLLYRGSTTFASAATSLHQPPEPLCSQRSHMEENLYFLENHSKMDFISVFSYKMSNIHSYVKLNEFLVLLFFSAHWVLLRWYLSCHYMIYPKRLHLYLTLFNAISVSDQNKGKNTNFRRTWIPINCCVFITVAL